MTRAVRVHVRRRAPFSLPPSLFFFFRVHVYMGVPMTVAEMLVGKGGEGQWVQNHGGTPSRVDECAARPWGAINNVN